MPPVWWNGSNAIIDKQGWDGMRIREYYHDICQDADDGKLYRYYRFWIILQLVTFVPLIVLLYYFTGNATFFIIFAIIGITNIQAVWLALDFARRNQKYSDLLRDGSLFMGTVIKRLKDIEIENARKENRQPLDTEQIANVFAGMMSDFMYNMRPLIIKMQEKNITADKISKSLTQFMTVLIDNSDKIEDYSHKLKKLSPIIEILLRQIDKMDEKQLGYIIGKRLYDMTKKGDGHNENG